MLIRDSLLLHSRDSLLNDREPYLAWSLTAGRSGADSALAGSEHT